MCTEMLALSLHDALAILNTFSEIEARRVRSTSEYVAAAIALAFAVILLGLAVVRVVSRYRVRTPASERDSARRSEEHTSELSHRTMSSAVFGWKDQKRSA